MNSNSFLSIESLPNELLCPILEACATPSLFRVCRNWRSLLTNAAMPALYKKIAAIHVPQLKDDIQKTAILDKIYQLESKLTSAEKVNQIFKQVFSLARSLSPQEFQHAIEKKKNLTIANYSSYLLNINRLWLWKKLPGGDEYLNSEEVKSLSLEKKGELLKERIKENYQNLTELDLYMAGLTYLPPEIGLLSHLRALDLRGNKLTNLPIEIGQLKQLNHLNLSGNQLTSLPAEIGQLNQLNDLALSHNKLTNLPIEIGQLKQLNHLNLSGNQLTSLPIEIGQLKQLNHLNLSGNQLTSLPAEIGQLNQLNDLSLSGNPLTSLPAEIGQLSQLVWLNLSPNQLTSLPTEIGQLKQLVKLDLSHNRIASLPVGIMQLPATRVNWEDNLL
ncbi:leucine-rich repeat domain-containing protein [Parachlamydia sp. AcF125]|uniref:leucine-rich repeat domain-containing protein n=1 Tax=Parachlamydia sp. AcF125 TaxID=2795736 RepID=UPI001BC900AE|nr:leucine-rich repeat domain-containing protein [Parachlamydia sp. AcF125]MBS4169206.1 E3 ubiquitin-protein ligase SspH2 [Parachlamydia sp. AcF125]